MTEGLAFTKVIIVPLFIHYWIDTAQIFWMCTSATTYSQLSHDLTIAGALFSFRRQIRRRLLFLIDRKLMAIDMVSLWCKYIYLLTATEYVFLNEILAWLLFALDGSQGASSHVTTLSQGTRCQQQWREHSGKLRQASISTLPKLLERFTTTWTVSGYSEPSRQRYYANFT